MIGLGPYAYRPLRGKTEEFYNRAWKNQKSAVQAALNSAMRFDKLGKRGESKRFYSGVTYIHFIMNYANIIVEDIEFLAATGETLDLEAIKKKYKVLEILTALPCISNCKGFNLRAAFLQIFSDFGINTITSEEVIPPCPGIGIMVIGSTLDDAFTVGGEQCAEGGFSEYDNDEYDNDEYTVDVT